MSWPTEVAVDVSDMAARMEAADLAIGAGGATTWERCALGLPSIIVQIAENQSGIARAMVKAGAALDPGPITAPDFAPRLHDALTEAQDRLEELSQQAALICDGNGLERVVRHILSCGAQAPVALQARAAKIADAPDIWHWRYAGNAARFFRTPAIPSLQQHLDWFKDALRLETHLLLMITQHEQKLGHVRLDHNSGASDFAEISIYLNPACRGAGFATPVLEAALRFARSQGINRFRAQAHRENTASIRLFTKAGFVLSGQSGAFVDFWLPQESERDTV